MHGCRRKRDIRDVGEFHEAVQNRNIEAGILVRIPSFADALVGQFDNLVNYRHIRLVREI